jgi:fumarylacetoacetase
MGPFQGKNFGTTISPWIITAEALEPFKVKLAANQIPAPLDYLKDS